MEQTSNEREQRINRIHIIWVQRRANVFGKTPNRSSHPTPQIGNYHYRIGTSRKSQRTHKNTNQHAQNEPLDETVSYPRRENPTRH